MAIKDQFISKDEQRIRRDAAILSLVVSVVLMTVKFWAFNLTHSKAIYSDALESVVNVMTGLTAVWVIFYSAKPADEDHPYGHGKVEFFSAAFEGGLIAAASIMIIAEAVHGLLEGQVPHRLSEGLVLASFAGAANLALGLFLLQRGKTSGSLALKASGQHIISDFWTSAGVVGGLALAKMTDMYWLDPVLALLVGIWLGFTGIRIVRESVGGLMDKEDPKILNSLVAVFKQAIKPGIIQIHNVKVIRSGWYHHIDAHIVVPEFWDVKRVHDVINLFEKSVISNYEFGGEMNFHVDPCRKVYCSVCDLKDCPIRQEDFVERMDVDLDQLRSPEEPSEYLKHRPRG